MNTFARVLLTGLRLAVGWHFLYEGLFKIDSDTGATAYAPARYPIQTATARLRDDLAQKPDPARVDAWNDEIVRVFKGRLPLSEDQKSRLNDLATKIKNGENAYDWTYVHEEVLKIAPEPEPERFTSLGYLQSADGPLREVFRSLVRDMDGLERLTAASVSSRLDARYQQMVDHYRFTPAQAQQLAKARDLVKAAAVETVSSPAFQHRLADYKLLRQRVKEDAGRLNAPFTRERLQASRKKLDLIAGEMLAFVNEPISELTVQAQALATPAQMAAGPLRRPPSGADWVDRAIQWALTCIGVCLMLGLFTPVAALAAAAQLAVFYLASPPWPHLPAASTAGHYLYIDRNFIEALVALLIAVTPTGRWAGLDAYIFRKRGSQCISTNSSEELAGTILVTR